MTYPIWKTITIGGTPNLAGMNISEYAKDLLKKVTFRDEKETIDLVLVSVKDLGFSGWPTTEAIYEKAKKLGLDLCPQDLAPWLRVAYKDQPENEWLTIGMDPIADQDGDPSVFTLTRDGDGLWLDDGWASPEYEWDPGYAFVFRLRKSLGAFDPSLPSESLVPLVLEIGGERYEIQARKLHPNQ